MDVKKRIFFSLAIAAPMAVVSLLLSILNNEGIHRNHLIGSVIAGIIMGYWILPSILKKTTKNNK